MHVYGYTSKSLPVTDYGQMEFVPPESGGTDLIHITALDVQDYLLVDI